MQQSSARRGEWIASLLLRSSAWKSIITVIRSFRPSTISFWRLLNDALRVFPRLISRSSLVFRIWNLHTDCTDRAPKARIIRNGCFWTCLPRVEILSRVHLGSNTFQESSRWLEPIRYTLGFRRRRATCALFDLRDARSTNARSRKLKMRERRPRVPVGFTMAYACAFSRDVAACVTTVFPVTRTHLDYIALHALAGVTADSMRACMCKY